MSLTFGSWFSGIGGVDSAAKKLNLELKFMVEKEEKIYKIAQLNFSEVSCKDVLELTAEDKEFQYVDIFHCSTPCVNFSKNLKKGEQDLDFLFIEKVNSYINFNHPKYFTFENVTEFERSSCFERLVTNLKNNYKFVTIDKYDFSKYGLPQKRKRLIIIASDKEVKPLIPSASKSWDEVLTMVNRKPYKMIKGVTKQNLNLFEKCLISVRNSKWKNTKNYCGTPAPTVISTSYKGEHFIIGNGNCYRLDVKDYAKLQGFYENFNFGKRRCAALIGIGNAVPPMIYEQILERILENE